MRMSYSVLVRSRFRLMFVVLVITLLISACSGNAQIRQQAVASEQQFQQALLHARQLGVNTLVLQPVLQRSRQLASSQPPTSLFSDQPIDTYYRHLTTDYAALTRQLRQFTALPTAQDIALTRSMLGQFQAALHSFSTPGLPIANFRSQLTLLQSQLGQAKLYGDYLYIQQQARNFQVILHALPSTSARLDSLKSALSLLQDTHVAATALQANYQADQADFKRVNSYSQFQQLQVRLAVHYQQAQALAVLAALQITTLRLHNLSALVQQISASHIQDASHQQHLQADSEFVTTHHAMTFAQLQQFVQQVDADTTTAQFVLLHAQLKTLLQRFHAEVTRWSNGHLYYDRFDGHTYAIDTSYLPDNFGNDADDLLRSARSVADLQNALTVAQTLLFSHQLLESDYADHTPYNQVHQTDLLALAHYHVQRGQVMVVSLAQQTLRLYQDGKLVRAFLVTTGRSERPSPPGLFSVLNRLSPTKFVSDESPGSPYWYPPTPINYAILMRADGYFVHDSWWRDSYGPGTQFPHVDPAGDESFAGNGSHGCVNLPTAEAAWLYKVTNWNTSIIVY
jgi:Uncharacterized protein conserved in bacteria